MIKQPYSELISDYSASISPTEEKDRERFDGLRREKEVLGDKPISVERKDLSPDQVQRAHDVALREGAHGENALLQSRPASAPYAPIVNAAASQSFGQRHPSWSKFFSILAGIISFPFLLVANVVITPFLMGAAFFSKSCGNGEWAKGIAKNWLAEFLWGRTITSRIKNDNISSWQLGLMAFVPGYGPQVAAMHGAVRIKDKVLASLHNTDITLAKIHQDLAEAPKLAKTVEMWAKLCGKTLNDESKRKWEQWDKEPQPGDWPKALSANLKRALDAVSGQDKRKVNNAARRIYTMLKVIEDDPHPFIPYLSTLGISGLGTCDDRPITVLMDLELRAEAQQTLKDIKDGKKNLQNMLDVAVKRMRFDEALRLCAKMVNNFLDPISVIAMVWPEIKQQYKNESELPSLLYRKNLDDSITKEQLKNIQDALKHFEEDLYNLLVMFDNGKHASSPIPWASALAFSSMPKLNKSESENNARKEELKELENELETLDNIYIEFMRGNHSKEAEAKATKEYEEMGNEIHRQIKLLSHPKYDMEFNSVDRRWVIGRPQVASTGMVQMPPK